MESSILVRGAAAVLLACTCVAAWADDADEPNGTPAEATSAGPLGFVRATRTLAVADEDWYRFHVYAPKTAATVEVLFDTSAFDTVLTVEVQSLGGAVLATSSLPGPSGYSAVTGPLPAGDYLVRVRHDGGGELGSYTLRSSGADDAEEPINDTAAGATPVGPVGFVRTGRALNFADQDWYRFQVLDAGSPVTVDVAFDTVAYATSLLTLEVQTPAGAVVATGSLPGPAGPYRAFAGALPVGEYLVRVRHDGGAAVSEYAVQAYAPLSVLAPSYTETTVGRSLDLAVDISGGIKPYALAVDDQYPVPPGLVFDGASGTITGFAAPSGRYDFMLTCRDAGSPANKVATMMTLVVNARLDVQLGEFTAFALGKSASRAIPFSGGTVPFATTMGSALPAGVDVLHGQLAFTGSAEQAGSAPLAMTVVDGAGLADSVATTAVVCGPVGFVGLAEGDAASGVYFDAVKGSVVSVNVATVKRQARRTLRAVLLGADGTTPVAAKVTGGNGKAALTRFTVPATGRYYLVVAAKTGVTTQLVAKRTLALPVKDARRAVAFSTNSRLEIPVGALANAVLSFSAKPDKKGMELTVQGLIDPSGLPVAIDPATVTTKSGGVTFSKTLNKSGTWTVVVVEHGGPATMSYSYKVRQPKGGAYSADE